MEQRNKTSKPSYQSPKVNKIELDKRISITMTSPPGDPPTPIRTGQLDPFR